MRMRLLIFVMKLEGESPTRSYIAIRAGVVKNFKLCRVGTAHRIRVLVGSAHPTCISRIFTTEIGVLYEVRVITYKLQQFSDQ